MKWLFYFLFTILQLGMAQDQLDLLRQLFREDSTGQYDQVLLKYLPQSLDSISTDEQKAELNWMLAKTQFNQSDTASAVLNWWKIVFLFPNTSYADSSKLVLMESAWDNVPGLEIDNFPQYADAEENYFAFLSKAYGLNILPLQSALIGQMNLFLMQYPHSMYESILLFWQAHLFAKLKQPYFAETTLRFVLQNFPGSAEKPQYLLELARLYAGQLNEIDKAKALYLQIIGNYPEPKYGGTAQIELAQLYYHKLADAEAAKSHLQLFQINYSEHPDFVNAIRLLARICKEQQSWLEACNYYQLVYENSVQDSMALEDLENIESIALNHLKDFKRAAAVLLIQAQITDDPNKLMQAAKIELDSLNNQAAGRRILDRIMDEYIDSPAAKEAEILIKKLKI